MPSARANDEALMAVIERHARTLAPATLHELRAAAPADEHGHPLRACLQHHTPTD